MKWGSLFKAPSCFRRGLGVVSPEKDSRCISAVYFFNSINPVQVIEYNNLHRVSTRCSRTSLTNQSKTHSG